MNNETAFWKALYSNTTKTYQQTLLKWLQDGSCFEQEKDRLNKIEALKNLLKL